MEYAASALIVFLALTTVSTKPRQILVAVSYTTSSLSTRPSPILSPFLFTAAQQVAEMMMTLKAAFP